MGWLRHDTNDIFIDAVLTDKGRELLAAQDGSFQISKFALSDEDCDYNVIQEFGRVVGKEKIEKNTPVLEALTNTSLSQKSSLISISANNPTMSHLPFTELGSTVVNSVLSLSLTAIPSSDVTVTQKIDVSISPVPQDVVNHSYTVEVNNLFLEIDGQNYSNITTDNVATYILSATSTSVSDVNKLSTLVLNLVRKSINTTSYSMYIKNNLIRTYVTIMGNQDGSETTFEVQISTIT
tara:strand:- start:1382 stop:2092 length:711 start_codon:yes stop_codon:yes gene_type:complete